MDVRQIKRIGVIGLGKMGMPMATHLHRVGFEVVGFDPSEARIADAAAAGIATAASPEAVAAEVDGLLVVVGFDQQARELFVDSSEVLSACREGASILLASTLDPQTSLDIGEKANHYGVHVADATMCRAEHAAVDGTLLILFGGDPRILTAWETALESFASDISNVGELSAGQIAKMINNVLLWICVIGNQEVLRLAEQLGVPQRPLIDALLLSSGANWALETWHKARPMPWAEDDLQLALTAAGSVDFPAPLSALVREEMKRVKADKNHKVEGGEKSSMEAFVSWAAAQKQPPVES